MLKKRIGKILLGVALLALLGGLVTKFWPTEEPRPYTLEFSVQCQSGARLEAVWVETRNDNGPAERTVSDPHNLHFGAFSYAVTDVLTKFMLRVKCVRLNTNLSASQKNEYTLTSPFIAWGNKQHFECDKVQGGCTVIGHDRVTIFVDCGDSAIATEVFVVPSVNAAGSASKFHENLLIEYFQYPLATPVTPYAIEVTCKPQQGDPWTAKSDPNKLAIWDTTFQCSRPAADAVNGLCTKR